MNPCSARQNAGICFIGVVSRHIWDFLSLSHVKDVQDKIQAATLRERSCRSRSGGITTTSPPAPCRREKVEGCNDCSNTSSPSSRGGCHHAESPNPAATHCGVGQVHHVTLHAGDLSRIYVGQRRNWPKKVSGSSCLPLPSMASSCLAHSVDHQLGLNFGVSTRSQVLSFRFNHN